jgi:hypothetical protein
MGQTQGEPLLATPSTMMIERFIPHDPEKPGSKRRLVAKPGQRPIGLHECLLRHVLGHAAVPDDEIGDSQGDLLM